MENNKTLGEVVKKEFENIYKQGCKDTAEKIIKFLDDYSDCDSAYLAEQAKEFITKQLGIEIKEN